MNSVLLGGAQTDFSRNWTKEGKTFLTMLKEVVEDAFCATNLDYSDISQLNKKNRVAVFVGNFDAEQYANQGHLGSFLTELDPSFYGVPGARYEAACASGSVALHAADTCLRAGDYDLAVVVGMEIMKTVDSVTGGDYLGTAAYYEKEAKGISFPFPKLFGQLADLIIEKSKGIKEERVMASFSEISRINYDNAKKNPLAQTRSWFMDGKHAKKRGTKYNSCVGGRLAITDCSQVTDGAAVLFLAHPKYAEEYAKRTNTASEKLSRIKGWGHRVAPLRFSKKIEELEQYNKSKYILPWTRQAVEDACSRAKISLDSIDVFETHDCFSSSEYAAISAFGITNPSEEYKAIEEGVIAINGAKPINPSGGLIGAGHPVGASGVRMMLDLHKQISQQAGGYQVEKDLKNSLMLNIGGSATTNMTFVLGKN